MRLADVSPVLAHLLRRHIIDSIPRFSIAEIRCETVMVSMRDGVRLATDLYLPPTLPAPVIAMRTPYGRAADAYAGAFLAFARRGYVVISQDCRGTGDSEPASWDYYMYEPEDGYDFVEWVTRQPWFDGFLGSCGGSYVGQTQWPLALHPRMSTIVPEVSGLGVAVNTAHLHMFANAYARSTGKGEDKLPISSFELEAQMIDETLATGYFNEPLYRPLPQALLGRFQHLATLPPQAARRWLWEHYCALDCAQRAELVKVATGSNNVTNVDVEHLPDVFGHQTSHDSHTLPHTDPAELCRSFHAPVLLRTGWYDWGLNDALATWQLLMASAREPFKSRCRLMIAPSAHNMPGYHEGIERHPELLHDHRTTSSVAVLLQWYGAVREGAIDAWPRVIYYLMGANEWRVSETWPVAEAKEVSLYIAPGGRLGRYPPAESLSVDQYQYDPANPTPTVGGSIVSHVYPPGSVDVREVQKRADVLAYTSEPLKSDVDVVGPLKFVLYASSSAVDTDFCVRLSDVFPDGRAIQLQNGFLRARYRDLDAEPQFLEPGRVYRFEIDLWATANRFKAGHRLRVDISSADFPRFDRNTNRGGIPGPPLIAQQSIYHDAERPSRLIVHVLSEQDPWA